MKKKGFWASLPGLLTGAAALIVAVVSLIPYLQSIFRSSKTLAPVPTTIGVFRPAKATSGQWLLRNTNAQGNSDISFFFGAPGDIAVVGDWTGKGTSTIGVFRPANTQFNPAQEGQWLLRNSNASGDPEFSISYGAPGDIPVVGDWTRKGMTTIGVFRPANTQFNPAQEGQWLLRNSNAQGNSDISIFFGDPGDIPVVGDWTGKGTTTIGVFRPANTQFNHTPEGQWRLRNSNAHGTPDISFFFGGPGDIPVVGDWTGKGMTTIGVFRPANTQFNPAQEGQWLLRYSNTPGSPDTSFFYGLAGDIPVVGPWSGSHVQLHR